MYDARNEADHGRAVADLGRSAFKLLIDLVVACQESLKLAAGPLPAKRSTVPLQKLYGNSFYLRKKKNPRRHAVAGWIDVATLNSLRAHALLPAIERTATHAGKHLRAKHCGGYTPGDGKASSGELREVGQRSS